MTFQPPSKSLTPRDYQFIALVTILFLIVSSVLVFANLTLTNGGGDFYVHWVGSRGFLFEKIDPYSGEVPARVQEIVYEDSAKAGDEPYILDTPFHLLLIYFPFSLLSDPQLARALFTLILELALFTLALLSLHLTDWEAPRYFWTLFLLFCIFNFYTFQAILESSPILLLGLIYAGILYALRSEQDELAGALMAVSLYYWEVGAPFLFLVAWRVYSQGRGRVLAGFSMLTIVLLAASFLWYPGWFIPYLRAGMNNLHTDFGFTTHEAFAQIFLPHYGGIYSWIFIGILILLLGYEWSTAHNADFRRFYWACCLSLAASPLLGFRTEMEHLSVLVIPLALIFAIVYDRWRSGRVLTTLLLLVVFLIPWAFYFFASPRYEQIAQESLFLFLPLTTITGLYWIRWWAVRPPRTWADLVNCQS